MNVLVVVDMQRDFIDGVLGTTAAQKIVEPMCRFIQEFDGKVFYTQDTHQKEYLETQEGKLLPVEHCVENTLGWQMNTQIEEVLKQKQAKQLLKSTFGCSALVEELRAYTLESITLIGVCTDICVVTNALLLKTAFPEVPIQVIKELCAGVTLSSHQAALSVLESCQIYVQ